MRNPTKHGQNRLPHRNKKVFVYRFEFKRDDSAEAALRQIEEMHDALTYAADKRILYKIGVSFDSKTRRLADWKVKKD